MNLISSVQIFALGKNGKFQIFINKCFMFSIAKFLKTTFLCKFIRRVVMILVLLEEGEGGGPFNLGHKTFFRLLFPLIEFEHGLFFILTNKFFFSIVWTSGFCFRLDWELIEITHYKKYRNTTYYIEYT